MSKIKDLEKLVEEVNKKHGEKSIFRLGDKRQEVVPHISTGILAVDSALGCGGFPLGKIVEVFGAEATGKSSLCLSTAVQAQKRGLNVAYLDTEYALNVEQAEKFGVNVDELLISQPETAEEVFEVIQTLIGKVSLIVVDSVNAMITKRELDSDFGDANLGIKAKLMSQALPVIRPALTKSDTCLVFLNQIRDAVGAIGHAPTYTTAGGRALRFYSDIRGEIKRMGQIKPQKADEATGHKVTIKFIKNRVGVPYKVANYDVVYADKSTIYNELLEIGVESGLIKKGGAYYSYGDVKIQSQDSFKEFLVENNDVKEKLEHEVRSYLGLLA